MFYSLNEDQSIKTKVQSNMPKNKDYNHFPYNGFKVLSNQTKKLNLWCEIVQMYLYVNNRSFNICQRAYESFKSLFLKPYIHQLISDPIFNF